MKKARLAALLCRRQFVRLLTVTLLLFSAFGAAHAQSSDIELPTPVRSPEIRAVITPRDVGDPRLTKHFYALAGGQGDLIISVESRNLDGDVDIFTAGDLRPLAKVSMYAGESLTRASKSVFLRRHENLILRVEARSPNDEDGSYTILFSGSFEASNAEEPSTEAAAENSPARRDKNARRVSSVGARIEEPPAEKETEAKTEEQPAPQPAPTPITITETPTPTIEPKRATPGRKTARTLRIGRPPARANAPKPKPPAPTDAEAKAGAAARGGEKNTGEATNAAASTRLIIETRDGTRVERFMSTVRRVTVENGMVVVITKDGKVDRQPLANILRMAIEQ